MAVAQGEQKLTQLRTVMVNMEHLLKTNFTKELGTKVVIDSIFSLERLQILESYLSERDANHFSDVLVNKDLYPEGADAFKP